MGLASMKLLVGCCGTAGLSLEAYARRFPVMEVQSTFYRIPRRSTVERWRSTAPSLVFTMKAFQGVTHPADSPTWRRTRGELEGVEPSDVGMLRPSRFVREAWGRTMEVAQVLSARVVVVQLPPSFQYTRENAERLAHFNSPGKGGPTIAFEFRHASWLARPDEAARLVGGKSGGVLVTDPLKMRVPDQPMQYHRLHGMDGFVKYRHRYTVQELERLAGSIAGVETFVLFDNLNMREDADKFRRTLARSKE